ncbi:lantibiotic dehydratase family protein [Streptomyces sp. NBC_00400]|uniref:lantibiotic dehydratase n=1 Tax=Streptomyces sp. NBC_00400 TaxID=2975737 RepID=UPI002E21AEC8
MTTASHPLSATETPLPSYDTLLGPRFMARVSGLPFDVVAGLRQPRSRAWAEQVADARHRLLTEGERLSDELHGLVKANNDSRLRGQLLNARRKLFTGAMPRNGEELADRVGGGLGAALRAWMECHRELDRMLDDPVVDEELTLARRQLRELAAQPRLRQGLLLASATLDEQLGAYLHTTPGTARLSKKQRRIERSLLEYVYRSACKTSPFSSFTGLALGEFQQTAGPDFTLTVDDRWSDHTQLNIAVLGRLAELITADERLRPDLPVTLVTGWTSDTDRIRYVRRTVTTGDDTVSASFDSVSETMFFLRHSGGLDALMALCAEGSTLRYGELLTLFAQRVTAGTEECERYLATLLRLGLLSVPPLAVDIHHPDPVRGFADALRSLDRPWSDKIAEALYGVSGLVQAYRGAPLAERRQILDEVRRTLTAVHRDHAWEQQATLPPTLVYEDTRAATTVLPLDAEPFHRHTGRSLASLSRIMPAFDMALPHRLTLRGFFLARYGRGGTCSDLLGLVSDFQEDIYDQYVQIASARTPFADDGSYTPAENWLDQPEITAVDDARRLFAEQMTALWESAGSGHDAVNEIELDDDFVSAVAGKLQPLTPDFRPAAHFLQLSASPDTPAVLNRSWGGLFFPFSRFSHGFDDLGLAERLRTWQQRIRPRGAVFAEVTGGTARTNLNLHGRLTDYEIVCPGEHSTAPEAARIPLEDLTLSHDPGSDRLMLTSRRLGREVIPVYFGYLVPMALPEVARILLLLSPSAMVSPDPWGGVPEGSANDGVLCRPRVRHGGVVLSRRHWSVPTRALPLRRPEENTARWFLRWQDWRRQHGMDAQVFVTLHTRQPEPLPGTGGAAAPVRRHKPHYLDFDSCLSLNLFEHLVSAEVESVTVTEMLPTADDLHTTSRSGRHITEIAVETFTPLPSSRPDSREER